MKDRAFCQRNLKPVFALLVLLIASTIVWAVVSQDIKGFGRAAPGAGAAASGAGEQAPGAGQAASRADRLFDAKTMATPNGGINLIAQPGGGAFSVDFRPAGAPARMQLVGGRPGSRHSFSTVSSLILPTVVNILAIRDPLADRTFGGGTDARLAGPLGAVPGTPGLSGGYESVGSGFIVDSRGYILTNRHVISQATGLLVSVSGRIRRDFPATVIAADPGADLALIKVSGAPALPEARLGVSSSVRVGDWVLAFGCPFGLEQTVTQGIVSGLRPAPGAGGVSYGEMIQTDAPTNQGSSGGPLVNLKAEVIGINTAIYGPHADFSGTGFAIPVDRAKAFLARVGGAFNR